MLPNRHAALASVRESRASSRSMASPWSPFARADSASRTAARSISGHSAANEQPATLVWDWSGECAVDGGSASLNRSWRVALGSVAGMLEMLTGGLSVVDGGSVIHA